MVRLKWKFLFEASAKMERLDSCKCEMKGEKLLKTSTFIPSVWTCNINDKSIYKILTKFYRSIDLKKNVMK